MSDEATPTEGAAEPAAAPQAPSIDFAPILDRFSQMEQRLESLQPEPQAQVEADPYEPLDGHYEDPADAQHARDLLESIFSARLEQAQKPLLDRVTAAEAAAQKIQADLELGDLEARYPRLADDNEYTTGLLQEAQQLAQQLGNPALASNAKIIETLHLARMGKERAAAETPAGGVPTGLESAGGASPGEPAPDLAQSIVRAGGQRTAGHQFWGA